MAEQEDDAMAERNDPVAPQHMDPAVRLSHATWAQLSRLGARPAVDSDWVPAWLRPTGPENRLPVAASILVAIALQVWLSGRYGLHPRWILPVLEIALLVVLTVINPVRLSRTTRLARYLSMALAGLITLDNVVSALVLDYGIVTGKTGNDALGLLSTGAAIYVTNIIVFGIWYWELDRGGPVVRRTGAASRPRQGSSGPRSGPGGTAGRPRPGGTSPRGTSARRS
jgi:hypothetical protein